MTCDEDQWSPWSSWSSCSHSCGGSHTRTRDCIRGDCTTGPSGWPGEEAQTQSCSEANKGILITSYNQAEVYIPPIKKTFDLPSIPNNPRVWHTLTGNVICGGAYPGTYNTCLELKENGDGWRNYSTSFKPWRMAHSA